MLQSESIYAMLGNVYRVVQPGTLSGTRIYNIQVESADGNTSTPALGYGYYFEPSTNLALPLAALPNVKDNLVSAFGVVLFSSKQVEAKFNNYPSITQITESGGEPMWNGQPWPGGSGGGSDSTYQSITLTSADITNKYVQLAHTPKANTPTILYVKSDGMNSTVQTPNVDYILSDKVTVGVMDCISWDSYGLDGELSAGDLLEIIYFFE